MKKYLKPIYVYLAKLLKYTGKIGISNGNYLDGQTLKPDFSDYIKKAESERMSLSRFKNMAQETGWTEEKLYQSAQMQCLIKEDSSITSYAIHCKSLYLDPDGNYVAWNYKKFDYKGNEISYRFNILTGQVQFIIDEAFNSSFGTNCKNELMDLDEALDVLSQLSKSQGLPSTLNPQKAPKKWNSH